MVSSKVDITLHKDGVSLDQNEPCVLQDITWYRNDHVGITMETETPETQENQQLVELKTILEQRSHEMCVEECEVSDIMRKVTSFLCEIGVIEGQDCPQLQEQLHHSLSKEHLHKSHVSSQKIQPENEMKIGTLDILSIDADVTRKDGDLHSDSSEKAICLAGSLDFIKKTTFLSINIPENCRTELLQTPYLFILLASPDNNMDHRPTCKLVTKAMSNYCGNVADDKECNTESPLETVKHYIEELITEQDKGLAAPSVTVDITSENKEFDPLKRTGRPFGGLFNDMRRRYPQYWSDIKDAFNLKCLAAVIFMYFVCITQVMTFGGLVADRTDGWMGVSELLVVTSFAGVVFSLFSAQPLLIVGTTGPTVLFEVALYQFCQATGVEFMVFRLWVCVWVAVVALVVVLFEGSFLVRYFSRFVMEIFTLMISVIFIYAVFEKLFKIFRLHPLLPYYLPIQDTTTNTNLSSNLTENSSFPHLTMNQSMSEQNLSISEQINIIQGKVEISNQPNTALLSLILTFGTFVIANTLKNFRNTRYFSRRIRLIVSDFAIPVAVVINVLIDFFIKDTYTQKLDIPSNMEPTSSEKRGWYINPFGSTCQLPIWAYFAAAIPGALAFILIFIQTQISGVIAAKKSKKGTGFHLDLLLVGSFGVLSGMMGLPLLTITTVRSLAHISALSVMGRPQHPDQQPKLIELKEQRVTSFIVHVLIGLSVFLSPILQKIPVSVLFGVFLYMGIAILKGSQLFDRIKLLFKPRKHHPNTEYVKQVKTKKMHLYTLIQVGCLVVLWGFRFTPAALAVPFLIASLILVRKFILPFIFKQEELNVLDQKSDS